MTDVRIGFIGCGPHSSFLQSLVRKVPGLDLVAVCDVDESKARGNAADFGVAECYTDHLRMLEQTSAELVAVVGTPRMHSNIGIEVLESGRHLFVEKPLGVDLADCRRLAAAAAKSGRIVMNGYMWRYSTPIARMKEISQHPDFGKPLSMFVRFLTPQPRFPVWGLDDIVPTCVITDGGHPVDIMMYQMGPVEQVRARLAWGEGGISSIVCALDFTSGGVGMLATGTSTCGVDLDFMLTSSNGHTVKIEDNMNRLIHFASSDVDYKSLPAVEAWSPAPLTVSDADHTGWTAELMELAACVLENRRPGNDMRSGLEVMQVMQAIKQSFTSGRTVKVREQP